MSHYEERLQRDLDAIRVRLDEVAGRAQKAVRDAVQAFSTHDTRLANLTVLRDRAINHGIRRLDRLCHEFVVRHVPSAGHLRWVSSVLRMNVALERVGDYAAAISRETVQLSKPPTGALVAHVERVGGGADRILAQSLKAFREEDEPLARRTIEDAREVDALFKSGFHDLVAAA
jgi:phosphate transport system protein